MAVQSLRKGKTVRQQVSKEEWQKRVDLAAAYRLMDVYGMTEMSANHISTRVPGEPRARSRCRPHENPTRARRLERHLAGAARVIEQLAPGGSHS